MTTELATVIRAVRTLSHREKLELLQIISQDLQHDLALVEGNTRFWATQRLDDLIHAQQTPIIGDVSRLGADFWPEDETADDINAYLEQQRRND